MRGLLPTSAHLPKSVGKSPLALLPTSAHTLTDNAENYAICRGNFCPRQWAEVGQKLGVFVRASGHAHPLPLKGEGVRPQHERTPSLPMCQARIGEQKVPRRCEDSPGRDDQPTEEADRNARV